MAGSNMQVTEWSNDAFFITDIVNDRLPTIVKVADGYYSENEAESFSNGDLIKLDFKRHYTKVKAQAVYEHSADIEEESKLGDEILIPLGYSGKLKIICRQSAVHSIKELLVHFPRFLTAGKQMQAYKGIRWKTCTRIMAGSDIEIDREIPGLGIICKVQKNKMLIRYDADIMCHVRPDETQYTIREVVEKFKMPQYVRFIESEVQKFMTEDLCEAVANISHFEGQFKITGVVNQEVVIGHHKPVVSSSSEVSTQRSIAILPLNSEVVQNLEVYVPVYEDFDDYELMVVQNFSNNVNLDLVEGSLYLEFQKKPRVHFLQSYDLPIFVETPPPRPPLPHVNREISLRDNPHPSDRGSPISQTKEKKKWRKPPSIPQHTDTVDSPPSPDGGGGGGPRFSNTKGTKGSMNRGDIPPHAPRPKPKPKPPTPVQKSKASLHANKQQDSDEDEGAYEEMRTIVVGRVKPLSHKPPLTKEPTRVMPPHVSFADESSDSEKENPYDEIEEVQDYSKKTGLDFTKLPKTFRHGLKKVHLELKKLKRTRSTDLKSTTSTEDLHVLPSKKDLNPLECSSDDDDDEPVLYDYPDLTKLASMPRPKPVSDVPRYQDSLKVKPAKPVGKIQPIARDVYADKKFRDLTSAEVVNLFKMTTLPDLASACEREGLDGSFLCSLSETELKKSFKLTDLQIIKVNKIINDGWRPNTN